MQSTNMPPPDARITSGSYVLPASRAGRLQAFSTTNAIPRQTINAPINSTVEGFVPGRQTVISQGPQVISRQEIGPFVGTQPTLESHRGTAISGLLAPSPPVAITSSRIRSSIRRDPIEVYTAAGPPLPPLRNTIYNASESIVRPVTTVGPVGSVSAVGSVNPGPIVQKKYIYEDEPVSAPVNQTPVEGPVIYEKVVKEASDPERDRRMHLYQGEGYKDKRKGTPCCLALLGLLALAGLLTGLFFLIRGINAGAGSPVVNRTDVNYKKNATTTNSTSNNTGVVVIPGSNATTTTNSTSPVVIDVNTNPAVTNNTSVNSTSTNTTTTTTTTTNTTNSGTTGTTTNPTANTTTNTNTSTNTTTNSNTNTGTNTNTNTSTSTSTTVKPVPAGATVLTNQQKAADPNVNVIDTYLRQQDATRLGTNPTLNSVSTVTSANGVQTYYYDYSAGSGKHYIYGVQMGAGSQPIVKTVSITQDPAASTTTTTPATSTSTSTSTSTTSTSTTGTTPAAITPTLASTSSSTTTKSTTTAPTTSSSTVSSSAGSTPSSTSPVATPRHSLRRISSVVHRIKRAQ